VLNSLNLYNAPDFKERIMLRQLADYSIDHPVFITVLLIIGLLAGSYGYSKIPVEAVPEIVIPVVLVVTPWPGVGPEEIEEEVSKPLETAFTQLDDIDFIEAYSSEGASVLVVQFVAGADLNRSIDDVQEKVNETLPDLPDDVEDSRVQDINFGDIPILELGLASSLDPQEFKRVAENFAEEIEALDGISRVIIAGEASDEVRIAVDPLRMTALGLSFDDITRALSTENLNVPAGNISPGEGRWLVRATGEFTDITDIADLPLRANASGILRLRDIADVSLIPEERDSYSRLDGRESIALYVQKKGGTNTIQLVDSVFTVMDRWGPTFGDLGIEQVIVDNQAEMIRDRFNMMNTSARYGILLVILIVWFFIGFRNSIIVALAIPFTLTLAFGLIYLAGISLADTSTFAIILVLGMLVDEDIVVVENTYRHLQFGENRLEAARKGIHEVGTPIFAAVLTTLAAFMPLLILSGIMGEFMKFIPLTVGIILVCAFVLAHTVLPVLTSTFLRIKKSDIIECPPVEGVTPDAVKGEIPDDRTGNGNRVSPQYLFLPGVLKQYEKLLRWSLGKSTVGGHVIHNHGFLAAIVWILLILAIFGITRLDQQLFPEVTMARFLIDINTPEGTGLDETDRIARRVEEWVSELPELKHYLVSVGRSGSGGFFSFIQSSDPTLAQFSIELYEDVQEVNSIRVDRIISDLEEKSQDIAGADIEFSKQNFGPPTGAPVIVRVMGDRMEVLDELAELVKNELEAINDEFESNTGRRPIARIRDDYPESVPEIRVSIDRERASRLGLSTAQVALDLRTALTGVQSTEYRIREQDRSVDIIVRLPRSERLAFDDIHSLSFRSPLTGALVPFSSVAGFETGEGYSTLQRRNQNHIVNVRMDLEGISPFQVTTALEPALMELQDSFPPGYTWEIGGEQEIINQAFQELFIALLVAILLIYVVLVWQFNSPIQPLVIMTSIPFAIVGIVLGLILTAQPFGLLPFMALVALSGIVVNDSIVLITYINQLRRSGIDKISAIIQACLTRLRPIIMTSVTTALGILPLTLGWGASQNESGAWFPFGISMIFGLMTATLLILIVVPTVYNVMTGFEEKYAPIFSRVKSDSPTSITQL